ncbi:MULTISPECIES: 3D domain-containing protein [Sporosarcina]|uniref:3D (Asp-Asp-Asp) domain-containing protein n=1 Tax=Sporosarcina newyorkensis TaxID=759851 RepID=A0A1T4YRD0_9BACL|nr:MULTISPECIES: 3D domain-containing protein [Sporosarcina]SKB04414.1 3D (Asp-Asp-Asp) domain-containing protein [Sporosarcina newyorkensis]
MLRLTISVLAVMILFLSPVNVQAVELGIAPDGELLKVSLLEKQNSPEKTERYTVKSGDTLYRIAFNQGLSVETLKLWNGMTTDSIHPGDELIVVSNPNKLSVIDQVKQKETEPVQSVAAEQATPKELTMTATAYTAYCEGCSGTTYTGQNLRTNPDQKVIAVDPEVVPIGSKVWVENYGEAIAGDIGGAIKGNKIDVFIPSYDRAMEWGVKQVKIRILD